MVELADPEEDVPTEEDAGAGKKKGGAMGLILGVAGAAIFGAGAFYAVYSGMILGGEAPAEEKKTEVAAPKLESGVAFLAMEPIIVSLGARANARNLQFTAQLEVAAGQQGAVTEMMPRIRDVLNTYLRALEERDFDAPGALIRLRAQMLRRVKLVVGPDAVRDLLISDFLLN